VVTHHIARNQTGNGVRVSWKIVPAVTEVWQPQPAHSSWKLHRFDIESFETLDETPLSKLFGGLRTRLTPPEGGRPNPTDMMRELREE
jgi:hypothetical protein